MQIECRGIIRGLGNHSDVLTLRRLEDGWEITDESGGTKVQRCTGIDWGDGKLLFDALQAKRYSGRTVNAN